MKIRSAAELEKALLKKGFKEQTGVNGRKSHKHYILYVDGKKTRVNTFLSHNGQDYHKNLMGSVKRQLCFTDTKKMDEYFDCTYTEEEYVEMLKQSNSL